MRNRETAQSVSPVVRKDGHVCSSPATGTQYTEQAKVTVCGHTDEAAKSMNVFCFFVFWLLQPTESHKGPWLGRYAFYAGLRKCFVGRDKHSGQEYFEEVLVCFLVSYIRLLNPQTVRATAII